MKSHKLSHTKSKTGDANWIAHLAGGLVHELKNPLSTIKMNLQLIEEDYGETETSREKRNLKKITTVLKEIDRLQNILDDFLRFSRSQKLECSLCDFNQTTEEVIDFIEPEALQNHIQILKTLDDSLPALQMDKNLIKQAILNLIVNAQQAMPEGGELILKTFQKNGYACLEVTDTGVGIPKDRLDKIWDVYHSSKKSGTGLGLPTTQRILEAHGGDIEVQSEVHKGSQFLISLPMHALHGNSEKE